MQKVVYSVLTIMVFTVFQFFSVFASAAEKHNYEPAKARVAAENVLYMTRQLDSLDLTKKDDAMAFNRYMQGILENAQVAKTELLLLWTDGLGNKSLMYYPDLHDIFWEAAKLCNSIKMKPTIEKADNLLKKVKLVHGIWIDTYDRGSGELGKLVPFILHGGPK